MKLHLKLSLLALALGVSNACLAAPEEIQVYMDEFAEPGKFGLDFHTNYVRQALPGSVTRKQLRVTPELSYGINENWEAALYWLTAAGPEISGGRPVTDGAKVRVKWRPRAPTTDSPWYGAVNVEVGQLSRRFYLDGASVEAKFIGMYTQEKWTLAANLNLDRALKRQPVQGATAELDSKISYRLRPEADGDWRIGVENYVFLGALRQPVGSSSRASTTYLVTDFSFKNWDVNVGLGKPSGATTDKWIMKAIIGVPFD